MEHGVGIQIVKGLQKELLSFIETRPELDSVDTATFNKIRESVFRNTFYSFKLGVIGLDIPELENQDLWQTFFGWFEDIKDTTGLDTSVLENKIFKTTLKAFRAGSMVSDNAI